MSSYDFYLPSGVVYVEEDAELISSDLPCPYQHYLNPGASITTKVFQKNVGSVEEFKHHQREKASDFKEFAHEFANKYGVRVEVGDLKSDRSLEKKLLSHQGYFKKPSGGEVSLDDIACTIHDGLRARFYVTRRPQLVKIANRLTSSQNSDIVDVQDGFMTLNEENHIPRYKVIYDFYGFNVELQIYHQGMEDALRHTDRDHKLQRAFNNVMANPSVLGNWKLSQSLSRQSKTCEQNRLTTHDHHRQKLKLDRFVVSDDDRRFYWNEKVGSFFTAPDPYEVGASEVIKTLRPDFERGMYVIDNGMMDYIKGAISISREEFVASVVDDYQRQKFPSPEQVAKSTTLDRVMQKTGQVGPIRQLNAE